VERGGQLPSFAFLRAAPGPIGLLFPHRYRWALQASFIYSRCPFGFFSWRIMLQCLYISLRLLGGDRCRSVGDQPPVLSPRGDPTRLGDLSVDPPLVVLLTPSPFLLSSVSFFNTRWGRVASTSLVEVNQAILAWSF
jgi:hypothetical protein